MKIILTGNPLSNQSIYRATCLGGFARYYMTKAGKDRKAHYIKEAEIQRAEFFFGKIKAIATLFFGDKRKRDIDNFGKLWMDALIGIAFKDDEQVWELKTIKDYDKENPRIEIELFDY